MNPTVDRIGTVLWAIGYELRKERITFMAGSLAYNAFVSMLPLLVLLLVVISEMGSQRLEASLLALASTAVTPGAGEVLIEEVHVVSAEVSIIGGVLLVWGSLRIFRTLDAAFSEIYETTERNTFTNQLFDGIVVFGSIAAVILLVGVSQSYLSVEVGPSFGWFGQRLLLVAIVGVALIPMYYLFPDEYDMRVLEAVPGALFTATGLVLFQSLFQFYLQFSSTAARESILASILVFLTWLYFSGLIILIGAAINAVLTNRTENVNIRPVIEGLPIDEPDVNRMADQEMVTAIEQLAGKLPAAKAVQVVVDDEAVPLQPPERADTDIDTSRWEFVNDTVGITLAWTCDEAETS